MTRPRNINKCRLHVIANYDGTEKLIKEVNEYNYAFEFFSSLVDFRLRGYMSFRWIKLVNSATHRLLCEYRDYRYIAKQNFENYEDYDIK